MRVLTTACTMTDRWLTIANIWTLLDDEDVRRDGDFA